MLSSFLYHLDALQLIMKAAVEKENPANYIYKKNARTQLFMLEAISKLFRKIHKDPFEKWKEQFKKLEDGIGQYDYFFVFQQQFMNEQQSKKVISYVNNKTEESLLNLNKLLKKEWFDNSLNRIAKIRKQAENYLWPHHKETVEFLTLQYQESITDILEFYNTCIPFSQIEKQIHALRRKLRWLSIYPHAFRGYIQLAFDKYNTFEKYQTKEVLASPFIQFPPPNNNNNNHILTLNSSAFLALCWIINELGKLKDEGLKQELLATSAGIATNEKKILNEATKLTVSFFNEHVLDKLVCR